MKSKILIIITAILLAQIYLVSSLTINSVETSPSEVQPGKVIGLDLSIKNDLSDSVDDVVVTLNLNGIIQSIGTSQQAVYSSVPFAPYQSSNQETIDTIDSDEHETVHFDLKAFSNAASGTYIVPLTANYLLSDGTSVENQFLGVATLVVNAKPNIVISSEESSLIKGKNSKITLMIVNSGLGTSEFLTVKLLPTSGMTITSPDSTYIGSIDSNDFDTADFNIFVNANAPSTLSLPVQVTYTDSQNNQITENENVLIKIYTQKEAVSLGLASGSNVFLIVIVVILVVVIYFIYRRARKRRRSKRNGQ